jgi:hypothetical protein
LLQEKSGNPAAHRNYVRPHKPDYQEASS